MQFDPLFQRLRDDLSSDSDQKARIRMRMEEKMGESAVLRAAKEEATPTPDQKQFVWSKVVESIDSTAVSSLLDRVRSMLTPDVQAASFLKQHVFATLAPAPVGTRGGYYAKWVSAFALVLIALRISPVLFLAPTTVAQSVVMLLPQGDVAVSLHGLWQPLSKETEIQESIQLQTGEGGATIILHDDGTIRLGPNTTVTLHDVTDRPEPALDGPTLTVTSGSVWVQGLLPSHVRGISIATSAGEATIHSGSMSIEVYDESIPVVRVWDRHVAAVVDGEEATLVSGERATLQPNALLVRAMSLNEYEEEWVAENLRRDAVHQREVAQMQQERRAARAGILPTSPLYPVKRVAERVDVLFTLNADEKVQKQIKQASTRLDEAAALIADGNSGAVVQLAEYRESIMNIATGTGGDSVTQFLLRQEIAENTAQLAASLPADSSYLLKKTVLEASADLPLGVVDGRDVKAVLLVEAIDALKASLESGDADRTEQSFIALQPYLTALEAGTDSLKPETRKEALSLLSHAATALDSHTGTGEITDGIARDLQPYLPRTTTVDTYIPLTEEEITVMVSRMLDRIFVFTSERPRFNQLRHEIRQLEGSPDAGRILRKMYQSINDENMIRIIRVAIQELRTDISPL